jgi:thiamine pyrophosphokinase
MHNGEGLVITGGRAPDVPIRIPNRDRWTIVAADSGADFAFQMGVVPDAIVGDMDSIRDASLLNRADVENVERYPRDKDHTDTEIACIYLHSRGIDTITIVGGGGGRMDHLLGIVRMFDRETHPDRWLTHHEEVRAIDTAYSFSCTPGETVSFFPVGTQRCTMTSSGLKWPLDSIEWSIGDAGISNECTGSRCEVTMKSGRLILIRSLPDEIVLE